MIGFDKCMIVIHIEIASWKCRLVFSGKLNHVMDLEQSMQEHSDRILSNCSHLIRDDLVHCNVMHT